jgi:SAM-dependent methyltransferase
MPETDQVRAIRDYYLSDNLGQPSIYHIWETGAGRGDVTTPAQSSPEYQQWMGNLLRGFLADSPDPGLLSLGCGNAIIEAGIAAEGARVLGVDAMEDAVELAKAKGVDAVCADLLSWTPPARPWSVFYADGSLGHLYDPETGVRDVLERFKSWMPDGSVLVISNDPPRTDDVEVTRHPDLQYFFLSESYMRREVEACGFGDVTSTVFTYQKPVSGPRARVVVTGRR